MFNPNNITDYTKFWKHLGTYYNTLSEDQKDLVHTYWKGLLNGSESLYYNLYQSFFADSLVNSLGYIEDNSIDFWMDVTEVEKEYLSNPTNISSSVNTSQNTNDRYSYAITAYNSNGKTTYTRIITVANAGSDLSVNNITLNWDSVSNATGYKIYGRSETLELLATVGTNSYVDDGSDTPNNNVTVPQTNTAYTSFLYNLGEDYYLSVPEIYDYANDTTLSEGTDYEIFNKKYIKFTNINSNWDINKFRINEAIYILPILISLYFKGFGLINTPEEIILNDEYYPYIKDFLKSNLSKLEESKKWSKHLTLWTNAMAVYLKKGSTLDNIKKIYDYIYNVPFNYESGEITNYSLGGGYHYFKIGDIEYEIPDTLTMLKTSGDVNKFELLCEGVEVNDYISNESKITNEVENNENKYYNILVEIPSELTNLNYNNNILTYYKQNYIPAGLKVIEKTV